MSLIEFTAQRPHVLGHTLVEKFDSIIEMDIELSIFRKNVARNTIKLMGRYFINQDCSFRWPEIMYFTEYCKNPASIIKSQLTTISHFPVVSFFNKMEILYLLWQGEHHVLNPRLLSQCYWNISISMRERGQISCLWEPSELSRFKCCGQIEYRYWNGRIASLFSCFLFVKKNSTIDCLQQNALFHANLVLPTSQFKVYMFTIRAKYSLDPLMADDLWYFGLLIIFCRQFGLKQIWSSFNNHHGNVLDLMLFIIRR